MNKPKTIAEFMDLVEQARFEIEELRAAIEYDPEDMTEAMGFVGFLESQVGELAIQLRAGGHEFRDEDLPFMAVVSKQSTHWLPFKSLLELINHIHRTGLDIEGQGA